MKPRSRLVAGVLTAVAVGVLRTLNDAMLRQDLDGRFITILYALVEVADDEARIAVACAGHPPAILVSPDQKPTTLPAYGDLLGIWEEVRLAEAEVRLRPGEGLVLYTDGVTNQGPDSVGSPEHALGRLAAHPSAGAMADALCAEATRSGGRPRDDVAIVALRYLPPADRSGDRALTAGSASA